MIVKTEAIVLRSRKYGETSNILNLYTKEFGKLSVIAKGARGPKSKFGSSLQPLGHVCAVLYKNDRRDLHLLSQCDSISRFSNLPEDLDKFTSAMFILELLEHVAHDEHRNDQLFELTLETLQAMNSASANVLNLQFYFELRLSDILGFRPNFHTCLLCGNSLDEDRGGTKGFELRLDSGGVACGACSERSRRGDFISLPALKILHRLQETTAPKDVTRFRLSDHQTEEVRTILRQYLQSHVGGLQRLRSQRLAARLT